MTQGAVVQHVTPRVQAVSTSPVMLGLARVRAVARPARLGPVRCSSAAVACALGLSLTPGRTAVRSTSRAGTLRHTVYDSACPYRSSE